MPTQDMILGTYYLSQEFKDENGEGVIFSSIDEAIKSYELKKVSPHAIIGISTSAFPSKK
ncbi:MAG: hypothetical protein K2L48_05315 [Mycoplasmoidaceae bacterium]|nr:hypothetical protein [Mycoplasmoidaceae bacterium]